MTATTAQVALSFHSGLRLIIQPMTSVPAARQEFGATLADAKAFVLQTACTECGAAAEEAAGCADCGQPACGCVTDPHDPDTRFCVDCQTRIVCGCPECDPDLGRDYYLD